MSKGLGKIEKNIIEILLEYRGLSPVEFIFSEIYGKESSNSQKQSVWRAIRSLEKKNIIEKSVRKSYTRHVKWGEKRPHGGASHEKNIRLVQCSKFEMGKSVMNSTHKDEVRK